MKLKLPPSKWLIWLNGIVMAKSYFINLNFPEVAGDFSLPKSYLNLGAKKVVWCRCNLTKLCFWCFVDILRKHIQWQVRALFGTSDQPLWRRSLELSWSNPGRKNRDPQHDGMQQSPPRKSKTKQSMASWWFQPLWKILVKMGIFPK